jgi:uncharacterized protein (TIGR02145 family)
MITVAIYIKDVQTEQYNRVDLFDDEKISVVSSIQNINDISKTFTDFSQTFTVPASKQNNKIFRHWYDNSNDEPFSTLVKSDAYIEIDTIPFRKGKIQLESANLEDGQAKDYSITFIGILGNLKDIFAGKMLKDLGRDNTYDFVYNPTNISDAVCVNPISGNVMWPLISSNRYWNYGSGGINNINDINYPIRYNELFPAIKLRAVLNMIETQFGINFDGTDDNPSTFLGDSRFTNAYLWLKNAEEFENIPTQIPFTFQNQTNTGYVAPRESLKWNIDIANSTFNNPGSSESSYTKKIDIDLYANIPGVNYTILLFSFEENSVIARIDATSISGLQSFNLMNLPFSFYYGHNFQIIIVAESTITFSSSSKIILSTNIGGNISVKNLNKTSSQLINVNILQVKNYFPEIKIEDFFSGLLKMFNLTCYSNDGINYTVEQLESYYDAGSDIDITKYVLQDKKALNRVKTYKKINFEYEKSESLVNVGFNSANGIEYGSLFYNTNNDGEEYSIKLPFENLNFNNLISGQMLQVGYSLKTDLQKYIPKAVILYDYFPNSLSTVPTFYFSNSTIGTGVPITTYKAFGQETLYSDGTKYSLNFNEQESTLINEIIYNGLYNTYYQQYFANIFNFKARLTKISAILPTSILTTLKLNDTILIRDTKYLINTMTTDLTSGVAQFELLTDQRVVELSTDVLIGTQLWTNRNLDVETYRDGTPIPQVTDTTAWAALTTGAWCYYANNTANGVVYGKLYNWYAVAGIDGSGIPRILAPLGYHVPTDAEWTTLTTYLGGESVAGGKMKATGTSLWTSPNTGATNESGFTGLGGGDRYNSGTDFNLGLLGFWWSSSEIDTANAWYRYLSYNLGSAGRFNASYSYNKKLGLSVRLIKD